MDRTQLSKYKTLLKNYAKEHFKDLLKEPTGLLKYKFIVPGSGYSRSLWDWDSWFIEQAITSIDTDDNIIDYEKGCFLNFIDHQAEDGRIPIFITATAIRPEYTPTPTNTHKPILSQRALFISEKTNDYEWLNPYINNIEKFYGYYDKNCKHESGLYFWINDYAIGVDNDPCTFFRPEKSSASILLNSFMYMDFIAFAKILQKLNLTEKSTFYFEKAECLKNYIIDNCYDEKDGFFYNVDINLLPINPDQVLHRGAPRHWNTLIQRIGVWSGFMAMYAGIATNEQAKRMVYENAFNEKTFFSKYGIRSLSKCEKMYKIIPSNNPSCWLGPVWGLTNYIVYAGLKKYGYIKEAKKIAEITVELFGKDIEKTGELHEFYDPETGDTVFDKGFQSWNLFAVEMADWLNSIK